MVYLVIFIKNWFWKAPALWKQLLYDQPLRLWFFRQFGVDAGPYSCRLNLPSPLFSVLAFITVLKFRFTDLTNI